MPPRPNTKPKCPDPDQEETGCPPERWQSRHTWKSLQTSFRASWSAHRPALGRSKEFKDRCWFPQPLWNQEDERGRSVVSTKWDFWDLTQFTNSHTITTSWKQVCYKMVGHFLYAKKCIIIGCYNIVPYYYKMTGYNPSPSCCMTSHRGSTCQVLEFTPRIGFGRERGPATKCE